MPKFVVGTAIETNEPTVQVEVSLDEPISVGRHTFQLVVVDDSNNESAPATVDVIVRDTERPTAVIIASPPTVSYGRTFKLDGSASTDLPPGKIVKYIWTMLR